MLTSDVPAPCCATGVGCPDVGGDMGAIGDGTGGSANATPVPGWRPAGMPARPFDAAGPTRLVLRHISAAYFGTAATQPPPAIIVAVRGAGVVLVVPPLVRAIASLTRFQNFHR